MKLWMKAAISLVLMALLIWQVDVDQVIGVFASTNLNLWLVAFVLFLFQQVVVAYCWQILLMAHRSSAPFAKTLEVHAIGSFFGTFLPSSVGMDIIRAYRLGRFLKRGVDAASSLFVARVVGFLVNFLLALIVAIPVSRSIHDTRLFWVVLILTLAFVATLGLVLHGRSIALIKAVLSRINLAGVADKVGSFRDGIAKLGSARRTVTTLITLSFFYQFVGIVIVFIMGRALSIELQIWHYFVYIPIITTVALLPVSLAGIGVREGAFVFFLAQAGVAQAQALSLSLLLFVQTLLLALLGGIWYFLAKENKPQARALSTNIQG